jgi:hypothetical protein
LCCRLVTSNSRSTREALIYLIVNRRVRRAHQSVKPPLLLAPLTCIPVGNRKLLIYGVLPRSPTRLVVTSDRPCMEPRIAFKESRLIADRRHSDRSLKHIGYSGENSTVSRVITKLIGMMNSVTSPPQTQPGRDTLQNGNSEHPNQDRTS